MTLQIIISTLLLSLFSLQLTAQPRVKYDRNEFGHGWSDDDHDCQNTRHEVLASLSTVKTVMSEDGCRVLHGRWISMFTGKVIMDASNIDIDHVVPLKWAWDNGARYWTEDRRRTFANDPANLIAVEASLNRQKGAQSPDSWLPPENKCQYVARFVKVSKKYSLSISDETNRLLSECKNNPA
ncbi:HNH endonuclease family protein [Thalassolituus oleivorans]|uniref:HNH endonuclease family protein n=1 Tax=Thalassolituus oleivorans TaxID=187493 RepID=UPI0023F503E6|nr:HNH endonuclease family protein [Thalassolituus oleivorans]